MDKGTNIFVAGHKGLVGSAIVNDLKSKNYTNVFFEDKSVCNYLNKQSIIDTFKKYNPEVVIISAARVGGIKFNIENPATMLYENITITSNLIQVCHELKIKKVIYLGSSCIYPRECLQPMKEEYLLSGKFEPTNEMYALAKVVGIKMIESYNKQYGYNWFSVQPCNIFGPNDNFSVDNSHFIAATLMKLHNAKINNYKEVTCWGTGNSRRENLLSYDVADAIEFLMCNYKETSLINIGSGTDYSIKDLFLKIKAIVEYDGNINFDPTKPDGMPKKLLDVSKLSKLGWSPKYSLESGLILTYNWFRKHK